MYSDRRAAEGQRQRKGLAGWIKRRVCIAVRRAGLGDTDKRQRPTVWTVERCVNCNQIRDTEREDEAEGRQEDGETDECVRRTRSVGYLVSRNTVRRVSR